MFGGRKWILRNCGIRDAKSFLIVSIGVEASTRRAGLVARQRNSGSFMDAAAFSVLHGKRNYRL